MTYCVGILLKDGIVLASDSRTHAGVDNFAKFCKMTVFERPDDRVLVLLSSGNLAGTQAVISILKQRGEVIDGPPNLWTARTMFDVVVLVADAVRDIERRDASFVERGDVARRTRCELHAVGEDARWQRESGGFDGWSAVVFEERDGAWLSVFLDGEVLKLEIGDRVPLLVERRDGQLHEPRGGAKRRRLFLGDQSEEHRHCDRSAHGVTLPFESAGGGERGRYSPSAATGS